MRIDKYLKVARILKKRPIAKELAEGERLMINDRSAKASSLVKVGDIVKIIYGHRTITIKVLNVMEQASKQAALSMYEIVDEDKDDKDGII